MGVKLGLVELSRGRMAQVETEEQTTLFDNWWESD